MQTAKRVLMWTTAVSGAFVCGFSAAVWLILAHGDSAGEPLMSVGAKLISASRPAMIEGVEVLDPMPGEMEFVSLSKRNKPKR